MHSRYRSVLATPLLLATAFATLARPGERVFAPWVPSADVKTAPEPSRPADPAPERPARTAESTDQGRLAGAKSIDPRAPISELRGIDHSRVYFDEPGDGSLWVRGANYKTSFDASGATYYPLFGRGQLVHHPHALSPDRVTIAGVPVGFERAPRASHVDHRVELDRGAFVEAYDFEANSLEQTFVFARSPGVGELVLHIPIASPLESRECAEGFEFHDELGRVAYGRATAVDARGRSLSAPTTLGEDGITIRVSAEFLAAAAYPLVIDPIVSTLAIDTTSYDNYLADVAYDATYDRWLVVYAETATASDTDVYHVVLNGNGLFLWGGYLNSNNANWDFPTCANLNSADQFLMVSSVGAVGSNIRGRFVQAGFNSPGGEFIISGSESGSLVVPVVGGDPFPTGPALYCVVYERFYSPGDNDILVRMVGPDGSVSGLNALSNSGGTSDDLPSISRSNGGDTWTISWERSTGYKTADVWCGRIRYDGVTLNGPTQITSGGYSKRTSVSSPITNTQRTLLVHAYDYGPDDDIHAILLDGVTVLQSVNLTILEGVQVFQNQREPFVDSDGQHFLVGYAEQYSTSTFDYDTYVADVYVTGNTIGVRQAHQNLDFSSYEDRLVRIASKQSGAGPNRRFMAVWSQQISSTNWNVLGALFDTFEGGVQATVCSGDGTVGNCPCGNNGASGRGCASSVNAFGALLSASGSLSTWNDTTVLTASGLPTTAPALFFQGSTIVGATAFGDGLFCISSGLIRIGTRAASAGIAVYPGPGDASISVRGALPLNGGRRGYQVWYRNSAPFCTSATFNLTNGVRIDWAR